jgi:cysteinyl-tRNA synthetase
MSKSLGNMVFVRDALTRATPQALRLYLLDRHYRRTFDHDESALARASHRSARLANALGQGAMRLGRDALSRDALAALDHDLDTGRAIRALESAARRAPDSALPSLRFIARRILGVA